MYPIGTATHSDNSVVSVQLMRLNLIEKRMSRLRNACTSGLGLESESFAADTTAPATANESWFVAVSVISRTPSHPGSPAPLTRMNSPHNNPCATSVVTVAT